MKKMLILAALAAILVSPIAHADSPQEQKRERAADRIENALERDNVLGRFDLDADAEGNVTGYIELEGTVRNASQRNRALSIARRVAPGYTLRNNIKISARAGR